MVQCPTGFIMNINYHYSIILWKILGRLQSFIWLGFYVTMTLLKTDYSFKAMTLHSSPSRYHPANGKRTIHTALKAENNSYFFYFKKLELSYEKTEKKEILNT